MEMAFKMRFLNLKKHPSKTPSISLRATDLVKIAGKTRVYNPIQSPVPT